LAAAFVAIASPCFAQTTESAPAAAPVEQAVAPAPTALRIPAGTVVQIEITEALSSETNLPMQTFGLRLAEPIVIGGREVVPAGAPGGGEVIDAHPSAFGGRQGRLILSGRFIEIGGQHARIRTMQLSGAGESRSGAAIVAGALVGIPAFLIQGGEVHIPAGTRASARLAVDVDIPLPAPTAAPATEPTQVLEGENQQ
jgi:hypothetical protein